MSSLFEDLQENEPRVASIQGHNINDLHNYVIDLIVDHLRQYMGNTAGLPRIYIYSMFTGFSVDSLIHKLQVALPDLFELLLQQISYIDCWDIPQLLSGIQSKVPDLDTPPNLVVVSQVNKCLNLGTIVENKRNLCREYFRLMAAINKLSFANTLILLADNENLPAQMGFAGRVIQPQ